MICEKCGCHDRVTRTIRREDGILRIRRCIACGNMIQTEEKKIEGKPSRKKKATPPKKDDAANKPKGALAQAIATAT